MTNVKPTLPREVANAIESLRKEGVSNFDIMRISHGAIFESSALTLKRYAFEGEHGGTPDLLMSALINGYEVEQSPEDNVRKYYDELRNRKERIKEQGGVDWHIFNEKQLAIKITLDLLGIKIDGINA